MTRCVGKKSFQTGLCLPTRRPIFIHAIYEERNFDPIVASSVDPSDPGAALSVWGRMRQERSERDKHREVELARTAAGEIRGNGASTDGKLLMAEWFRLEPEPHPDDVPPLKAIRAAICPDRRATIDPIRGIRPGRAGQLEQAGNYCPSTHALRLDVKGPKRHERPAVCAADPAPVRPLAVAGMGCGVCGQASAGLEPPNARPDLDEYRSGDGQTE